MFESTSLVWCQVVLLVSTWLWYFCLIPLHLKIYQNIIGSFLIDPFSVFINFGNLFLNFIVCIFGTVAGYILIDSGSLPEIELISVIVIECVLNSFRRCKLLI